MSVQSGQVREFPSSETQALIQSISEDVHILPPEVTRDAFYSIKPIIKDVKSQGKSDHFHYWFNPNFQTTKEVQQVRRFTTPIQTHLENNCRK